MPPRVRLSKVQEHWLSDHPLELPKLPFQLFVMKTKPVIPLIYIFVAYLIDFLIQTAIG